MRTLTQSCGSGLRLTGSGIASRENPDPETHHQVRLGPNSLEKKTPEFGEKSDSDPTKLPRSAALLEGKPGFCCLPTESGFRIRILQKPDLIDTDPNLVGSGNFWKDQNQLFVFF